jgi:hypothetical protein
MHSKFRKVLIRAKKDSIQKFSMGIKKPEIHADLNSVEKV